MKTDQQGAPLGAGAGPRALVLCGRHAPLSRQDQLSDTRHAEGGKVGVGPFRGTDGETPGEDARNRRARLLVPCASAYAPMVDPKCRDVAAREPAPPGACPVRQAPRSISPSP